MAKTEHPLHALSKFIPEGSFDAVASYIYLHKIHITITKKRHTILGDYRHATSEKNHRISVNGNLNPYEFLITLLHEIAHLITFSKYQNKVEAHGKEWKEEYGIILAAFIQLPIFPPDIHNEIKKSIHNPAATASGEIALMKVLRRYNTHIKEEGVQTVESIANGGLFQSADGRIFQKLTKRRSRYECVEVQTKRKYAFSAIAEVKAIQ